MGPDEVVPADEQEHQLRWLFTRRQQMIRTRFFHAVLTPDERREILELGKRDPQAAEQLFQRLYREHQAAASQPAPPSPSPTEIGS